MKTFKLLKRTETMELNITRQETEKLMERFNNDAEIVSIDFEITEVN